MLNIAATRYRESYTRDLGPTGEVLEGQALVYIVGSDGRGFCQLSTGVGDEEFAGVAIHQNIAPKTLTVSEDVLVPNVAPYTFTLKRAPIATPTPQMSAVTLSGGLVLTVVATAPAAGEVQIVNNTLTFNVAQANTRVRIVYRYAPTTSEAQRLFGDQPIGYPAADVLRKTSVITEGDVSTDMFVVTDNWNVPDAAVYLGANGLFTKNSTGTKVGSVLQAPSPDSPFLTIHLAA